MKLVAYWTCAVCELKCETSHQDFLPPGWKKANVSYKTSIFQPGCHDEWKVFFLCHNCHPFDKITFRKMWKSILSKMGVKS